MHLPLFFDVVSLVCIKHLVYIKLDFLLVHSVLCVIVFPLLSCKMHVCIYCIAFDVDIVYQQIILPSIILPSFVLVSLSISELHEHASSHCSLLWYEKDFVYQQIITTLMISHETLPYYQVS